MGNCPTGVPESGWYMDDLISIPKYIFWKTLFAKRLPRACNGESKHPNQKYWMCVCLTVSNKMTARLDVILVFLHLCRSCRLDYIDGARKLLLQIDTTIHQILRRGLPGSRSRSTSTLHPGTWGIGTSQQQYSRTDEHSSCNLTWPQSWIDKKRRTTDAIPERHYMYIYNIYIEREMWTWGILTDAAGSARHLFFMDCVVVCMNTCHGSPRH